MRGFVVISLVLWVGSLCIAQDDRDKAEISEAYFDGQAYIARRISRPEDQINVEKNIIAFEFRTIQPMGLIFHGSSSGGTVSDYITIELVGGKLRYSASLGSYQHKADNHEVYLGDELADGSFHQVLVERTGSKAKIFLDFGKSVQDEAIAMSKYKKLNLDQYLFIGGTMQTGLRGVLSTINFEGCLRNFKFGPMNLLSKGVGSRHNVNFQCTDINYVPVTFTTKSGTCTKTLAPLSTPRHFKGKFMFRTYAKGGTVLTWGSGSTSLQVHFKSRFVELIIRNQETLSVNFGFGQPSVDKGLWIKVSFSIKDGAGGLSLTVNGKEDKMGAVSSLPDFGNKLTIGSNFVGCVQDFEIDGKKVDFQSSEVQCSSDVQFKKCNVSDHCNPNPCLNKGVCKQEDLSFECTCEPDYEGSVCQFSKHPKTCNEIRLKELEKGVTIPDNRNYTIDPDGSGPIQPFLVYCNMSHGIQLSQGMTVIRSYDHHVRVRVGNPSEAEKPESFIRDIRYYPNLQSAKAVAMQSEDCRQYIEYSCINSKLLNNGNPFYGRWVSARNKHEKYWGGAKPDSLKCACGKRGDCIDKSKGCNCDAERSVIQKDYGYLTDTHALPVTQVLLGDVNPNRGSYANVSVGDLYCSGKINNTATFVNEDGYVQLDAWTPPSVGDISFLFRTPYAKGIILHNGEITREYVRVHIINNQTLRLEFRLNVDIKKLDVKVKTGFLNDRKWHKVMLWHNQKEFGLELDGVRAEEKLPLHLSTQLNAEGKLNIGGYSRDQLNGFVGCIKGLTINGKVIDLYAEAKNADYVKSDCGAACTNHKCFNSAECIDNYNIYKCNCDSVPFYGYFCHREIGASFVEDSKIEYEYPNTETMIGTDVAVAFATKNCGGQILEIKSSDSFYYYKIRFRRSDGKLIFEYKTGPSEELYVFKQPSNGKFCDNERHTIRIKRTKPIASGQVFIQVDKGKEKLEVLGNLQSFPKPKFITIGGQSTGSSFSGCISGVKVTQFKTNDVKLPTVDPIRMWQEGEKGVTAVSVRKDQCGTVPTTPPIPTKRIPDENERKNLGKNGDRAPEAGAGTSRNEVAVIVVVVLILVLIIIALLVLIYCYWSRHKGTYHTHEDDENQETQPYIGLQEKPLQAPTGDQDTKKKKEWFI